MLRKLLITVILVVPTIAHAENVTEQDNCFSSIELETIIGDSLTLYTVDAKVIQAVHPIFNVTASSVYLRQGVGSGPLGDLLIPVDQIDSISFIRPTHGRWVPPVIGLIGGFIVGARIGLALDTDSKSMYDSPSGSAVLGGFVGAAIGAVLGQKISGNMTNEVTISCLP